MRGHLDPNLPLKEHILIKCKAASLKIIKIWNIRKYLTEDTWPQTYMATGYIMLKLCQLYAGRTMIIEYRNHEKNPKHSCKTTFEKNEKESTMWCLKTMHWLPIQQRIDYKICTLIHKCYKGKSLSYLQNIWNE